MAKKTGSDFSKSRSMRELDEALNKSFLNIKNDMTALKEGQHQHGVRISELKQDLKDGIADFVTLDKFNILKIKIGELNENMKKVWDIEKKLEDIDRKAVSSSEFDKRQVAVDNELAKMKEDVKELEETAATEEQTKHLVKDINGEFDKVKQSIEELRSIKDTITRQELDKRTDALDKKAAKVRDDFEKVKATVKSKVSAEQVEQLVSDINGEFDSVKEKLADIKEGESRFALDADVEKQHARLQKDVEKQLAKIDEKVDAANEKLAAAMDEFSKGVETAFTEFTKTHDNEIQRVLRESTNNMNRLSKKIDKHEDDVAEDLAGIKKTMKDLVTRKQAENLVKDINKEFDKVKDEVEDNSKDMDLLAKQAATKKELAAEVEKIKNALASMTAEVKTLKKESATRDQTDDMFGELKQGLLDLGKQVKLKFDELTNRVKKDSDDKTKMIKSNTQDINAVDKDLRKEMKTLVVEDDLHSELDVVRDEFERLHKELKKIKQDMLEESDLDSLTKQVKKQAQDTKKEYVGRKHFNKLVDAVEKLHDQVDKQDEMLKFKNQEIRELLKEVKAGKKAQKQLARYESVVAKSESKAQKRAVKQADRRIARGSGPAQPFAKSRFFANFLIGAAFVILVAAIVFFVTGLTQITDILAIAAVVSFVLGVIIRIVVGFKNGN